MALLRQVANLKKDSRVRPSEEPIPATNVGDVTPDRDGVRSIVPHELYARDPPTQSSDGGYFRSVTQDRPSLGAQFETVDDGFTTDDSFHRDGLRTVAQVIPGDSSQCATEGCVPTAKGALQHLLDIILREIAVRRRERAGSNIFNDYGEIIE